MTIERFNTCCSTALLVAIAGACSPADPGLALDDRGAPNVEVPRDRGIQVYGGDTQVDETTSSGHVGASGTVRGCSGTLIRPNQVLTAAHCVCDHDTGVFELSNISVTFPQDASQVFTGSAVPHPQYACVEVDDIPSRDTEVDVAVVTLTQNVPSTLATPHEPLLFGMGIPIMRGDLTQPCQVVGRGRTSIDGDDAGTRRVGTFLPTWRLDQCGNICENFCSEGYLWTSDGYGDPSQAYIAPGDSGGGLFCNVQGEMRLVGVAKGDRPGVWCNDNGYTVHVPTAGGAVKYDVAGFLKQQLDKPLAVGLPQLAVYATGQLRLNDSTYVQKPHPTDPNESLAGEAAGRLARVGVDAVVGNLYVDGIASIANRAEAVSVRTTGYAERAEDSQVFVVREYQYQRLPALEFNPTFKTKRSPTVSLEPGEEVEITSKSHGDFIARVEVKEGAVLEVGCAHHYEIGELVVHPGGKVLFDTRCGAARLYVRDLLSIKGELIDDDESVQGDILIGYTGEYTAFLQQGADATVVAPNAKLNMDGGWYAHYEGAYFAQNVELHQGSTVLMRQFPDSW